MISHFTPWSSQAPRITKVTSLDGVKDNDLYEHAIRSHEEHDRIHGYETKVFREKIIETYWSKPALLLSVLAEQLEKPANERTEWLMWVSPDVMVLNPQIPLEIFLPPDDFKDKGILATRDQDGVNSAVFFIRVHPSSVKLLIEVLAIPQNEFGQEGQLGRDAARRAFEKILRSDTYRDSVLYQPRKWYNAYQNSVSDSEAEKGDLFVHFHGLGGDKWGAMASRIASYDELRRDWNLPLEQTKYEKKVAEFWSRIREAKTLLWETREQAQDANVDPAYRRLQYATTYETDDADAMDRAISSLRQVAGKQ